MLSLLPRTRFTLVAVLACGLLSGCNYVFKLSTEQGNIVEDKKVSQVQVGMTREQVQFLLGTPMAQNPFRDDVWDYAYFFNNPRGKDDRRLVSIQFDGDTVKQVVGFTNPNGSAKPVETSPAPANTLINP